MRTGAVVAAQALSEYLNVNIKRRRQDPTEAARQVALWSKLYLVESTSAAIVVEAAAVAARYKLPFWDALILEASRSGGATVLLPEDLQDGLSVGHSPFGTHSIPQTAPRSSLCGGPLEAAFTAASHRPPSPGREGLGEGRRAEAGNPRSRLRPSPRTA